MEKAVDYRSLSRLVMAHIRPGVITNNFMEKTDYLSEIERGTLYYETWEGGLMLLRHRRGFSRLNYYLTGTDADVLPKLPEKEILMTEHVFRPGDDENMICDFLSRLGFETLFRRARFTRAEESGKVPADEGLKAENENRSAGTASLEDTEGIYDLLTSCFSAETGCLPEKDELPRLIEEGRLIRMKDDDGEITGVLHFKPAKKTWEIRHLAVSEQMRGKGLAGSMAEECFRLTQGKTGLVWAREDYKPAVNFYLENGYRPDGWTSAVMRRTGTEK